ncbi:antigen peptide transporter 2 [Cololabis saira]|uniref:antigen peptide transporter 2 n=1 Tax=Cololabis saira TaxID=129043 RepID=UPI002AD352A3|nr:antigen peptide transporter 2 [Cololabis saira]
MRGVLSCGLLVVLGDVVLSSALWAGLLLLGCSGCFGLTAVWAFAAVKWLVLDVLACLLTDGEPPAVLRRFVAALCLLPPAFETGCSLKAPPSDPYAGTPPDFGMLLWGAVSSSLACVVWEMGLCGDGKMGKDKKKVDAKQLFSRVLTYFKPDTFYLIAAFSFLILAVFCDTYIPLYQGNVIDILSGQVHHTSFSSAVGQLVLLSLGSGLFSGLRGGLFKCSLARLNKRLMHVLFHSFLQQEVHFFEENNPGQLSSRLHSDVDRMGRTIALNANAAVRSTVKTFLMLRVMLSLSWELTLLTCVEMPLQAALQSQYIALSKELKEQIQDCQAQNKDLVSQTVGGIRTVRSFRAERDELRRYQGALDRMRAIKTRAGVYSAAFGLIRRLVTLSIKMMMLIEARSLISSGQLSVGTLVTFLLYQKPMSVNLREILYSFGDTLSTVGVISKVLSYLDRTPRWRKEGHLCPEKLEGRIVFQDVTFSYPSALDKPALKSVSVELQPGKVTALVGSSGSGKTSLVSLLKRLYEPQEGRILLDGEPLHLYQHKHLHQKVAVVSQNPVLFSGSLRYNIGYGLKDCSSEKMKDVARMIEAHDFICEMEDAYDTDVGEGGGNLSEGQKQSIAIMRVLVRDPQVIILDEATSQLDVVSTHAVLQDVLARGRTVLIVAHQLKTIETADHIVVMEKGSVVEEGTDPELMARRGAYYRLKKQLFSESS